MASNAPSEPRVATSPKLAVAGAGLLYALLTLAYLGMGPERLTSWIPNDQGDPLFNLYLLERGARALAIDPGGFFDADFFYPTENVVALSDHLAGPSAVALLVSLLTSNWIAIYNIFLFSSFVACGLAAFWVLRRAGSSWAAALVGGGAFAFSPYRWDQIPHLQMLLAATVPLVLWFWDRLLADVRPRRAALFAAFYLLHVSAGAYLAYLIHFPMLVLLLNRFRDEWRRWRRSALLLAVTAAIATAGLFASFYPYVARSTPVEMARNDTSLFVWGGTLASFITVGPRNNAYPATMQSIYRSENALFAGASVTVLALVGLVALVRRRRPPPGERAGPPALGEWLGAGMVAVGLVMADLYTLGLVDPPGPGYRTSILLVLFGGGWWLAARRRRRGHLPLATVEDRWSRGMVWCALMMMMMTLPMTHWLLRQFVFGLIGMRVTTRGYAVASFAIACLAAWGAEELLRRLRAASFPAAARHALPALLAVLLLLEGAPRFRWVKVKAKEDFPAVYQWLAENDEVGAVLELPIYGDARDMRYLYYSTGHWKPLVNGYSGYFPPGYEWLKVHSQPMPDEEAMDRLARDGVTHVVVHNRVRKQPAGEGSVKRWRDRFVRGRQPRARRVARVRGATVYELLPVAVK